MTVPHLDDEQLSLLLDGIGEADRAHLDEERCETCGARLDALRAARQAVVAATVPALAPGVLDRLVGQALAAAVDPSAIVPITAARRRRIATPPPAWLLGAVAGIAVLVGIGGFVRAVDSSSGGDGTSTLLAREDRFSTNDAASQSAKGGAGTATAAATGAAAPTTNDPEVISGDLGDQDDPVALGALLGSATFTVDSSSLAAGERTVGGGMPTTMPPPPPAPSAAAAPDRAQCRPQAEAIGAGRFAGLVSTTTARWKGKPAEVLVFTLAQPPADGSVTRQALVLARPGCGLLADPRF
ncbi:MAG TPA: hypothetical protein VM143_09600 [Acidimicrobiales bacterium]|nr:hypothetical protein [Acidimicrobiales bacterium]